MAILEIKKYPEPILQKRAKEVEEITEDIKKLARDMAETMMKNGMGLAAPQVGELKRIIVVQTEKGPEVFINPKILKKSKETAIEEEGCLSIPGIRLRIKRAKEVLIKTLDIDGKALQIEAKDLEARVFQHEIDHLEGILFIDRISFFQRWKIRKKLKEIQR